MRITGLLLVVLGAFALSGCYGQPVPRVARAGSTIMLFAGGELFDLGFSSEITRLRPEDAGMSALLGYDDQRGEMQYLLRPVNGAGADIPLKTRYITRVAPDPASPAAIASVTPGGGLGNQVVAFVDIPADVPPRLYKIRPRIVRRLVEAADPANPNDWEVLYDPASNPSQNEMLGYNWEPHLYVLPAEAPSGPDDPPLTHFNSFWGLIHEFSTFDVSSDLASLVPLPKLTVLLDPNALAGPAAGQVVIDFPEAKVEIKSVFEDLRYGSGSLVRWRVSNPPDTLRRDGRLSATERRPRVDWQLRREQRSSLVFRGFRREVSEPISLRRWPHLTHSTRRVVQH